MPHAAENIIYARVGCRVGVIARAVAHDLGRGRIEQIVHRQIELNVVVPPVGAAQVEIGNSRDGVVVYLNARGPAIDQLGRAQIAGLYRTATTGPGCRWPTG